MFPHIDGNAAATIELATLLRRCRRWPSAAAVSEARAIGPDRAGAVVRALLDADPVSPNGDRPAVPAATLAGVLRLDPAAASLLHCVERLRLDDPLSAAALRAIDRIGPAALEPALAAFDACPDPLGRSRLGGALVRTGVKDGRVFEALLRSFREKPDMAAVNLAEYGDRRAIPELSAALDGAEVLAAAGVDLPSKLHVAGLAGAVELLGGTLSAAQRRTLDTVLEWWLGLEPPWRRSGDLAIDEPRLARPPAPRPSRPGRNQPCPCGSGRKYEKCHLEADRRGGGVEGP